MNKRILAALLCLSLCVTSLPCAAGEELYSYPAVDATIPADDQLAVEMAFREWAAELLYDYYAGSYKAAYAGSDGREPFAEYYRLAVLKRSFDREKQNNKHIIYNTVSGTEADKQGVYTWVLLESLKEAVRINSDEIIAQFNATPKAERKYLMLDIVNGTLTKDEYVENAQERMDAILAADALEAIFDIGLVCIETALQVKFTTKDKGDLLSDVISGAADTLDAAFETLTEAAETNALINARNEVRTLLANELASEVLTISDIAVGFLKNTYSDLLSNRHAEYRNLIETFLEVTDNSNPDLADHVSDAVQMEMAAIETTQAAQKILDDAGYEVAKTLDPGSIAAVVAVDTFCTLLEESVKILFEMAEEKFAEKGLEFTIAGKTISLGADDLMEYLSDCITKYLSIVRDQLVDQYFDQYLEGTTVDIGVLDGLGERMIAAFDSKDFKYELIAGFLTKFAPDVLEDLSGNDSFLIEAAVEFLDVLASDLFTNDSTSETAGNLLKIFVKSSGSFVDEKVKDLLQQSADKVQRAEHQERKAARWRDKNQKRTKKAEKRAENYRKEAYKLSQEAEVKAAFQIPVFDVVTNVWDRAWETGTSIRAALDSAVASANGEGRLSLLTARVHAAREMSFPLLSDSTDLLANNVFTVGDGNFFTKDAYSIVMDREKIPLDALVKIVSRIKMQLKYDIVGAKSYFDVALHFWEGEEYLGLGGSITEDEIRYNKLFATEFVKYMFDHYSNIYGENQILTTGTADRLYDEIVFFENHYFNRMLDPHRPGGTWDPAWDAYFQ